MIDRATMPTCSARQEQNASTDLAAAVRELAQRVDSQQWPRWLDVPLAARYTSSSPKSIRNLAAAGRLTPSRALRGKLLFDRLELDALMQSERGRRLRRGRGIRKA